MTVLEPLDTFRLFANNRLFAGIEPEVLRDMRYGMQMLRFETDEVVFHERDAGDSLYLVGTGSVRISKKGRAGGQETLGVIEPGNFFWEMALLDRQSTDPKLKELTGMLPNAVVLRQRTARHMRLGAQ